MKRAIKILGGLLLLALALLYWQRDAALTALGNRWVAAKAGLQCEPFTVHMAADLGEITTSELTCSRPKAALRTLITSPVHVTLGWSGLERIDVARVSADWHPPEVGPVETNILGDIGRFLNATDTLFQGMLREASHYSPDSPRVHVDHLSMNKNGKPDSTMIGFDKRMKGGQSCTISDRAKLGDFVDAVIDVRKVEICATPYEAHFSAQVYLEDGDEPAATLNIEGSRMGSDKPHFKVTL